MAKRTKKWEKDFEKRYSNAIKELQSLEEEYKQMKSDNQDGYWFTMFPNNSDVYFGVCDGFYVFHSEPNEENTTQEEHISITLKSELGSFNFDFTSFEDIKTFRNDLLDAFDKFKRPEEITKITNPDECEDEEGWEDNEETEYTIQCSRSCTQSWTHTVMARSTCEAIRKAQEGEGHDENDDYDDYGEIDYESI